VRPDEVGGETEAVMIRSRLNFLARAQVQALRSSARARDSLLRPANLAWLGVLMGYAACIQPRESAALDPSVLLSGTSSDAAVEGARDAGARQGAQLDASQSGGQEPPGGDGDVEGTPGRDAGSGQGAGSGDADAGGAVPRPTKLTFDVLTKSLGGIYAPRNIGAIWIESSSGTWIKTLALWAATRERYLSVFNAASGGNKVDAVTSATLWFHQNHEVTWDLADSSHNPVPDGEYRVMIETTDSDGPGDSTFVGFTKGPTPLHLTPPDQDHYVQMSLSYE
jgi:hypothetical protein